MQRGINPPPEPSHHGLLGATSTSPTQGPASARTILFATAVRVWRLLDDFAVVEQTRQFARSRVRKYPREDYGAAAGKSGRAIDRPTLRSTTSPPPPPPPPP